MSQLTFTAIAILKELDEKIYKAYQYSLAKAEKPNLIIYLGEDQLKELESCRGLGIVRDITVKASTIRGIPFVKVATRNYLAVHEVL